MLSIADIGLARIVIHDPDENKNSERISRSLFAYIDLNYERTPSHPPSEKSFRYSLTDRVISLEKSELYFLSQKALSHAP